MASLATVKVKIEPQLKDEVETIFQGMGLTPIEAIKLFYRAVKLERKLPFDLKIPNDETLQTIRDAEERKDLTECEDVDDLFRKLRMPHRAGWVVDLPKHRERDHSDSHRLAL
jgi:DNA-damage-inducible protein J